MDHMEFSIALPPYVEMTGAGMEWTTMKQRLNAHVNHSSDSYQHHIQGLVKAFLINIAAEQVQQVFNMYGLSYEEAVKFNRVLQRLEDVCLPRFLIIYNRYKFFTCKQNCNDKFDDFLKALLSWSENCEFGDLKDILLKDCIITGITDDSVRQSLLKTEELDFTKTLEICRAVEQQQRLRNVLVSTDKKVVCDACVDTEDFEKDFCKINSAPVFCDASTNTDTLFEENSPSKYGDNDGEDFEDSVNTQTEAGDGSFKLEISSVLSGVSESGLRSSKMKKVKSKSKASDFSGQEEKNPLQTLRRSKRGKMSLNSESETVDDDKEKQQTHVGVGNDLGKKKGQVKGVMNRKKVKNDIDQVVKDEKEDNFLCSRCGQSFESHKALVSHTQEAHGQTQSRRFSLKCRVCKLVFTDLVTLRKHRLKHKNEKRFKCETCSSTFSHFSHLKVHVRVHTGERPFTCDTCGASFPEASKLKAHQRKHTGEKPYKCNTCQRTFAWSAAYTRHLRTHTGEKPYTCDFCGSAFADFTSLQRHRRTHTKEKPYVCDTCEAKFSDPSALKLHKRIHTGERPYSCGACGASFARSQHLKEHMKLHTGEKPFECETCGARFLEASKLKSHKRKHTGEKPYLCKICGTSFAWTAAYTRHMRTHTLEKPYFCDFCGSRYADHSTLTRHRRTHTGERPYACKVCSANFADSSSLHRHMRIHTGEKSYTCEVCGSSFAVKCYLLRHMRTHTGEKPYKCETCESKFTDSSKLNRHKKIHVKARIKQEKQQAQQRQEELVIQQQEEQHYQQLQPLQHLLQQDQHLQHEAFQLHQQLNSQQLNSQPLNSQAFQPELTADHQSMTLVQDLQHPMMVTSDLIPLTNTLPFSSDMIS